VEAKAAPGFSNLTFSHQFLQKDVVFLVSSGEKVILPLLPTPAKTFLVHPRKSTIGPSLKKIPLAPMFRGTRSSIEMLKGYTDEESLGTPVLKSRIFYLRLRNLGYERGVL